MSRYHAVTEAPRADLMADLAERIIREEHLNPDRPDRAEAYRTALRILEGDATEVRARHTLFRVAEDAQTFYGLMEGTRAELIAELDRYGSDRHAHGKEDKAREFARAIGVLERGGEEVQVGRIVYRVMGA